MQPDTNKLGTSYENQAKLFCYNQGAISARGGKIEEMSHHMLVIRERLQRMSPPPDEDFVSSIEAAADIFRSLEEQSRLIMLCQLAIEHGQTRCLERYLRLAIAFFQARKKADWPCILDRIFNRLYTRWTQ